MQRSAVSLGTHPPGSSELLVTVTNGLADYSEPLAIGSSLQSGAPLELLDL